MNQSQRWVSRKTAQSSSNRRRLVVFLALAISAVGYTAFQRANPRPDDVTGHLPVSDCAHQESSAAHASQACDSVTGSTEFQHRADASSSANALPNAAKERVRGRHAANFRTWDGNQSYVDGPRPGYTMAELCLAGLEGDEYRCRTGRYDEIYATLESGTVSGHRSGHTISGRVLTGDGIGLDGVTVIASPERLRDTRIADSETLRFWTVTNSLGAYSLSGLPAGEYTIRSRARGPYRSARYTARTGVDYADLVMSRDSATVVAGQVLSASGEPLEGVTVLPVLLGQPSVLSGYDGRFRLPVTLKSSIDSFAVRFQRPGFVEQSSDVELRRLGEAAGATVHVVMHPVESWTSLSGSVYSDSGEPLAGRAVELRPSSTQQTYRATTDQQGQYTFPFLESPAAYRLVVFGGIDHRDHQQTLNLTADMAELDVVVESYEFGEVTGQLVNLNGVPVPEFELVLRNTGSRKPNALVSTDTFGNFEIPAVPAGELVVASQSTPSILVQGLRLSPGDKLHLPLVLDWGNHQIRGIVVDASGNPVPASRIVLQWSHEAGGITTSSTRRTAADTQGHFAFSNLGPGPHSLHVDAPGFRRVDLDHDLSRQGYAVTVRLN